jgi:hypothetical protein
MSSLKWLFFFSVNNPLFVNYKKPKTVSLINFVSIFFPVLQYVLTINLFTITLPFTFIFTK